MSILGKPRQVERRWWQDESGEWQGAVSVDGSPFVQTTSGGGRCEESMLSRCELPAGHDGWHRAGSGEHAMSWVVGEQPAR